jgi:periplasmic protein TonB
VIATSRQTEVRMRTQAIWAHRRRLWCAAAIALSAHAGIYYHSRSSVVTDVEYGMQDPVESVDVELVAQAPEPAAEPPPPEPMPEPEPVPEPPTPEPVPEPPPEPPKPDEFATPVPPKPEPKPVVKPVAKPQSPKPSTPRPPAPARLPNAGGGAVGLAGGRTGQTSGPGYLYNPKPPYPSESRAAGEQGSVVLRVAVDATGRPTNVVLSRSSGHSRLDRAAQEGVRRWRFKPKMINGVPCASSVDVPVRFSLR